MRSFLLGAPVEGAFNIPFQVVKVDPEEAMYKELLIGLSNDTLPETVVFPDTIVPKRSFLIVTTKAKDVTLEGVVDSTIGSAVYNSNSITTLRYPNLVTFPYPNVVPQSCPNLSDLYAPKARSFHAQFSFYGGNFSHLNVHIDDSCENIMAYPNFPGTQDANLKPKLTFVGTDGSLNWNGSEWVKS